MIIGITGTDGAGKGEKRIHGASQEVVDNLNKLSYNLNSTCKVPVPNNMMSSYLDFSV
jgi:hypothetical protein